MANQCIKWVFTGLIGAKSCEKQTKKCSKEKAAEYYSQNKEAIKENLRERYKNLSQEKKFKIKEYQKKISVADSVQKRSVTK